MAGMQASQYVGYGTFLGLPGFCQGLKAACNGAVPAIEQLQQLVDIATDAVGTVTALFCTVTAPVGTMTALVGTVTTDLLVCHACGGLRRLTKAFATHRAAVAETEGIMTDWARPSAALMTNRACRG